MLQEITQALPGLILLEPMCSKDPATLEHWDTFRRKWTCAGSHPGTGQDYWEKGDLYIPCIDTQLFDQAAARSCPETGLLTASTPPPQATGCWPRNGCAALRKTDKLT